MGSVQMPVVGTALPFVNVLVLALTLVFQRSQPGLTRALTARNKALVQALGFDMFRVQDGMIAEHWDAD